MTQSTFARLSVFGILVSLLGASTACGGGLAKEAAPAPAAYASGPAGYPAPGSAAESESSVAPVAAMPAMPPPPPSGASGVTASEGRAFEAPQRAQLTAGIWDDNANASLFRAYLESQRGPERNLFSPKEMASAEATANGQHGAVHELDVQFVIDTTGSMGDEIAYLQREFDTIARDIEARLGNVKPRWSLVLYRDHGDDYVTRKLGFTTDASRFRAKLREQSAGGGGDMPEAVVEGLSTGLNDQWREGGNVARISFWVADAPAHPGEGELFAGVVRTARRKGVHVYPIAASGVDDTAEYQMRSAAQLTGGRYLFLTDDSGVGNGHAEPHIPCYNVTRLRDAIVRVVDAELTGARKDPEPTQVVRTVGAPKNGKCTTQSGSLAIAY